MSQALRQPPSDSSAQVFAQPRSSPKSFIARSQGATVTIVAALTYSREQLAQALGVGVATLDRMDANGRLGPCAVRMGGRGGRKVYVLAEVEEWLAARNDSGVLLDRKSWMALKRNDRH